MANQRTRARELAHDGVSQWDTTGWFELLYAEASGDPQTIPWSDMRPNPNLTDWVERQSAPSKGGRALVVGCGLGDDAEYLARAGFHVTAFDISPTAIQWCRRRFPSTQVAYEVHDLFSSPESWCRAFDLVMEAYTLQVLPPQHRQPAIHRMTQWVSLTGRLLIITRGRELNDAEGQMPWPLTRQELAEIENSGLVCERFEDYFDGEDPPVRRFRVVYRHPLR
jgi:SAM-dependent methyltransferase